MYGFVHLENFLSQSTVDLLAVEARNIIAVAPLMHPTMRDGTPLKVQVTSAGAWGWWSDSKGYRYVDRHPRTGQPFPPIPDVLRTLTRRILAAGEIPDCGFADSIDTVLINWYEPGAMLGWHIDRTEEDKAAPIVSISLGDTARFEIKGSGGVHRFNLFNGDVCVQSGLARTAEHRIAKVVPHAPELGRTHNPLSKPGRLNFTIRRHRRPEVSSGT